MISVIDLRTKFVFPPAELTKESCIIVMKTNNAITCVIVDTVSEVFDIRDENLESPADSVIYAGFRSTLILFFHHNI